MYRTAEMRWFYEGHAPAHVDAWFRDARREPSSQPVRVDYYLRIDDGDSLGVKLREGRLEVKQRQARSELIRLRPRVSGVVERWRKWGVALAEGSHPLPGLSHPRTSWIEVEKERALCRYRLEEDRQMVPFATDRYPDLGCDLELTHVRVREMVYWTLALEVFGQTGGLREHLLHAAGVIFGPGEPPTLQAEDSYGYPRWLEHVDWQHPLDGARCKR